MRILVHDYAGHAFPLQLARQLARRGHIVLHLHLPEFQSPKGTIGPRPDDLPTFCTEGISLGRPFAKSSLVRRWRQERVYGARVAQRVDAFRPEVVLSNAPLDAQRLIQRACQRAGVRFIVWVQDLYSVAIGILLQKKLGFLAKAVGSYYRGVESALLRTSDATVFIADDFRSLTASWGIGVNGASYVLENWAPLDEIWPVDRNNAWSKARGLYGKKCLMYAGTLAKKHEPALLTRLAEAWRHDSGVAVVVISEGAGREELERERRSRALANLYLFDYQAHAEMPDVLGTADVLIALLNADAAAFSVPSKVLSYLCAGRPIVAAVPKNNLAARTVLGAQAGLVVEPDDVSGLVAATERLLTDGTLSARLGANGRRYADSHFNIESITECVLKILRGRAAPCNSQRS
jgi:colanic acid biosynthesis glycosyl transferase WcaI